MAMLSSSAFQQEARETKITHILRQGTWQGRHHQLCRRKEITHFLRSIHGKVVIRHHQHCRRKPTRRDHAQPKKGTRQSCCRQHCTGSTCDEITHKLRRGHDKVVIISIVAGSPCHKITHNLRRGNGKLSSSALQQEAHATRSHTFLEEDMAAKSSSSALQQEVHATISRTV